MLISINTCCQYSKSATLTNSYNIIHNTVYTLLDTLGLFQFLLYYRYIIIRVHYRYLILCITTCTFYISCLTCGLVGDGGLLHKSRLMVSQDNSAHVQKGLRTSPLPTMHAWALSRQQTSMQVLSHLFDSSVSSNACVLPSEEAE